MPNITPPYRHIAIGYVRVSTGDQAAGGLGLDAQRAAIAEACRLRGLRLEAVHVDAGISATDQGRPGLRDAVAALAAHPGATLIVAKLDRLARSLSHYAALADRSRVEGWRLLALDAPDMDSPSGEAMAGVVAVFAQLERRLISQRTRDALAAARARGVVLGHPVTVTPDAVAWIMAAHRRRWPARRIAAELDALGFPTPGGAGSWRPASVCAIIRREGGKVAPRGGRRKVRRGRGRRRQVEKRMPFRTGARAPFVSRPHIENDVSPLNSW